MASREEKFTATIEINSQQAKSRLNELKKDVDDLKKEQRKALAENTTEGKKRAQQLQKEIDLKNKLYRQEEKHVMGLNAAMQSLSGKTYKDMQQEVRALNKLMRDGTIEKNSEEWAALAERVKAVKREMKEYEQAVTDMPRKLSLWEKATNFLNKNWGALTQIIGAATGLSMTIRKVTSDYAEMEQEMANVRKYTGQSMGEVERMNEDFKKMDTRTSREQLNQLAGAAGRLGITSTEAVEEFVDAADKIDVALGDDLGDGAVDQIGKLAMAFGEDERMGLRGAMLATGSAINELAQNSSAQAGYLVDFTARVAGFGKQLGLTQAQIMGFGAVMDENLLRDEMASTAFGNMLTKMQTDTAKFAKIAGKDIKEFSDLIKNDANQAVLTLAENLRRQDSQTMMKMLDDMGLDGARAVGVLSTLADKIDDVRDRQRIANDAYAEGTSVIKEFGIQNNTVQAGIDKAKKRFLDLSIELGEKLLPIVKYTISSTSLLIKGLNALMNFVSRHKILIVALSAEIAILNAKRLYGIGLAKKEVLWNSRVAQSIKSIGTAIKANPWGIGITAITAFVALLVEAASRTAQNTKEVTALVKAHKKATEEYDTERSKIEMLNNQVHNNSLSYDKRKEALDALKEIVPDYLADLDKEKGLINDNTEALTDYLSQLEKSIKMKAAQEELEEAYRKKRSLKRQEKNLNQELGDANLSLAAAQFSASTQANRLGTSGMRNLSKGMDLATKNAQARVNSVKGQLDDVHKQLQQTEGDITELNDEITTTSAELSKMKRTKSGGESEEGNSAGGYKTEAELKKEEAERKKKDAEKKKYLKDQADAAKASLQEQLAFEMLAYRQGTTTYTDYMEKKHNLTQNYYDQLKRIYGEDSKEYKKALLQQERDESEYNQWRIKQKDDRLLQDKYLRDHNIRMQYAQQGIRDEEALNEALLRSDIAYLKQKQNLYQKGSKEWLEIEQQIQQKNRQHQFELEQSWMQRLSQYRQEAGLMDFNRLQDIELKGVETFYGALVRTGRMTQAEYDAIVEHIKRRYAELSASQTADNSIQEKAAAALDTAAKKAGVEQTAAPSDAATGIFSVKQAVNQQKLINEQLKLLYGEDYENNREYQEAKRQLDAQTMQTIVAGSQAAYSTINSLMSAASSYAQACSDAEVARINKNYEEQIAAAGNNSKKRAKLEKERDKEIAKAKTAANEKAMKIELAQAIAQSALGAISAYSSTMAGAPYPANLVLAPISAAIALAAGALQIATIKKQHEAEALGYYEGGFTGGSQYRKEAGVVHEGEFVANHQAVNNRQLMPVFTLLDQAQRNNRVGSLRAEDVTNVMGGPAAVNVAAPIVNVQNDSEELRDALDAHREATEMLIRRIEEGIPAYSVIDGPDGTYHNLKKYERLISKK
ncbi:phage tail tape measure protein [Prevotella sp. E9-3]|uniref:phage tail tape measure protein n=1 Tax=Prevotella sp. E9-3 TaxID=2913621 RepID=UPI001EDAC8F8|nr:phage tail tape measure protein [Prevotella sp. E9-3]UKK48787.1 phage tail tape measure protein [Prevotella sp. E9-3]